MNPGLREWGAGDVQAVALHCSLAHSGAWESVARRLPEGVRLTAPDLVGHGAAPDWDKAQDFHDQATAHAKGFLPDAPCHLIGHSFGATVALRLALEMPDRVASLVLIEPVLFAAAAGSAEAKAHLDALEGMDEALAAQDIETAAAIFLSVWGGGAPLDMKAVEQRRYMIDRLLLIIAANAALNDDRAQIVPRLGQVACPVLLLEGATSPPVIAAIQTRLARDIPGATRQIIDGAGHMLPLTHGKQVAAAITAHLSQVDPGRAGAA